MRVGCAIFAVSAALLFSLPARSRGNANEDSFRDLLEHGFQFHQRGEYANSLPLLRRAWQLDPKDYHVNLLLGIDLLRTGKRAEAIPFLQTASRQQPADEFAYEYLGEAQTGLAHYAEAAAAYAKAVEVAPQSSQAAMAFVDFSLERFRQLAQQLRSSSTGLAAEYRLQAMARPLNDASRQELLERAAALDENAPGIWSELALTEIARTERDKAVRDVARAKHKNASDLRAWEAEALLAAETGNWPAVNEKLNVIARHSSALLSQAANDWPRDLRPPGTVAISGAAAKFFKCIDERRASCQLTGFEERTAAPAQSLFEQQRWEHLAALPARASQEKEQWYLRGAALAHIGDCKQAIPALERGLGAPSNSSDGPFLLSWCYARQAGNIAKNFEQTGAEPALLHVMRGDLFLRLQGNSKQAIAEYRKALEARPRDASILERLAEAQLSAGQMDDARNSAQTALQLDPRRYSAKRTLAEIALSEREYRSALPYLREMVATDPNDLSARAELGTACAQTGSLEEALQNLAPALQHGYPDEKGMLHYQLGTVLRRLGRTAEAAHAFETARQLSDASERRSHQEQNARP
ncbi:MAG TPA: tetratricopeptide repeat protein [Bryobacteraceae bacterium]